MSERCIEIGSGGAVSTGVYCMTTVNSRESDKCKKLYVSKKATVQLQLRYFC